MSSTENEFVKTILKRVQSICLVVFGFSCVVNLFMLISPLYSLQVLDRVLNSQSLSTLFSLSLLMLVMYVALMVLQTAKSFALIKLGEWLDRNVSPEIFKISLHQIASNSNVTSVSNNLRDFQVIKNFVSGHAINNFLDAPWSIIYVIVLFWIHPWMGWLSIIGILLILISALVNTIAINKTLLKSNDYNIKGLQNSEIASRNAEVIEAMGMMKSIVANWSKFNNSALDMQSVASYRNGIISNFSRYIIRMVLQLLVTGLGAYLVITRPEEMTTGGMIASSIILGRALTPFDAAIEIWRQVSAFSKSYKNLKELFLKDATHVASIDLPKPSGKVVIENVSFLRETDKKLSINNPKANSSDSILKDINLTIESGEIVAVMGPSGVGKSTLIKLIVGVWQPSSGVVRLDGADVYLWNKENFGKYIGYLPQDVELFSGTIKTNIARLDPEAKDEDILTAAKDSGAHDMISYLPQGYHTDIGIWGASLSGGQRQRVGLARAFYGKPSLIVLDEPNANLDKFGVASLSRAILKAKSEGVTVIIISHREDILNTVDKILYLEEGEVSYYGKKEGFIKPKDATSNAEPNTENNFGII